MKAIILASVLALTACEQDTIGTYISESDSEATLCMKGAVMSDEYADLMRRALALNNIEGGLIYVELQATKTELDILLKDACGYEIPTEGTMI